MSREEPGGAASGVRANVLLMAIDLSLSRTPIVSYHFHSTVW